MDHDSGVRDGVAGDGTRALAWWLMGDSEVRAVVPGPDAES
jgi:hypothetical protein